MVPRIDLHAVLHEHGDELRVALACRLDQTVRGPGQVQGPAHLMELGGDGVVQAEHCVLEGGLAPAVRGVHVRAGFDEQLGHRHAARSRSDVQRRLSVVVRGVHVKAPGDEGPHRLRVPARRRAHDLLHRVRIPVDDSRLDDLPDARHLAGLILVARIGLDVHLVTVAVEAVLAEDVPVNDVHCFGVRLDNVVKIGALERQEGRLGVGARHTAVRMLEAEEEGHLPRAGTVADIRAHRSDEGPVL
mmetsp:Transcript_17833/g.51864  ORF Transcript_17833/g.51864 Transcript_17833/m.51864 type:complete len:245 (+) Transcript_17833:6693-7427(+)